MAKIDVEIADTPEAREFGLQFVKDLPAMSGMLFKFERKNVLSFWMKNCYLPLDIAFIEGDTVMKVAQMVPMSLRSISSDVPCSLALEVPAGTLEDIGVEAGSKVSVDWNNGQVIFDD